jgi:hypothetical protein
MGASYAPLARAKKREGTDLGRVRALKALREPEIVATRFDFDAVEIAYALHRVLTPFAEKTVSPHAPNAITLSKA